MKKAAILLLLMTCVASAQWSHTIDTITTGNFNDIDPQVDHAGLGTGSYGRAAMERGLWLVFEGWNGGSDAIETVKFLGSTLNYSPTIITLSPAQSGVVQKNPDICSIQIGTSIAAWQVKSDSVWNIEYSVFNGDSGVWSTPALLTNDSVSNTNVEVRTLFDSSFVLLWKRGNSILFSVYKSEAFSPIRTLVQSNTDSTDYDFAYNGFVWTDRGASGNRFCLYSSVQNTVNFSLSVPDTILADGDISDPRFVVYGGGTPGAITFNLHTKGKYSAYWSLRIYPDGWSSEQLAGDSSASYLHAAAYFPPYVVDETSHGFFRPFQLYTVDFIAWERQSVADTSVVFYGAGVDSIQEGSSPSISSVSLPLTPQSYMSFVGFVVWQSDRSGTSRIYSRSFLWTQTAVDEPTGPPTSFRLDQNYPNPFNPATNIGYRISSLGFVSLKVYDVLGRLVATLVNGFKSPGDYELQFDGSKFASGVYFYRLIAPGVNIARKMLLEK
ncbi:MAG: T9SS type A sorting domain-containing protein [Bacteroidetes bacterium]|nr:T9SS type A sorting domain-containing protein [Bacteroidota bacterium]